MVRRFLFALFCCFLLANVVLAGGLKKKKKLERPSVVPVEDVPQHPVKVEEAPVVPLNDRHVRGPGHAKEAPVEPAVLPKIGHQRQREPEVARAPPDLSLGGPESDTLEAITEHLDAIAEADESPACWFTNRVGVRRSGRSQAFYQTSIHATTNWGATKRVLMERFRQFGKVRGPKDEEKYKLAYRQLWNTLFRDADLTINFFSSRWAAPGPNKVISIIDKMQLDTRWKNMWQVDFSRYARPDTKKRDDVEMEYLNFKKPLTDKHLAQFEANGVYRPDGHCERNERPNYAAANWRKDVGGATNIYGTNYLVLKPHVKLRSTFTPASTFEMADRDDISKEQKQQAVGTYRKATGVFAYMKEDFFTDAMAVIYGERKHSEMPQETYIEAQIFGGIVYQRDVAYLVIDIRDHQRAKLREFAIAKGIRTLYLTDRGTKICKAAETRCPAVHEMHPPLASLRE